MVDAISSSSNVNAIKGTEFAGMSIQMMAAMVMLEIGSTKKQEAENKIAEMKAQNDKAKQLNNFVDTLNAQLGKYTKDDDDAKNGRKNILAGKLNEAKSLGIDCSGWNEPKSAEQVKGIVSQIQHMAENCNSDNQTQMVKLQDFMGQYNSFVSGASDHIKNANQILQGLAKG
ncbi:MAG TPA: hypothetical protein DCR21_07960 [Succinivibrionaceae bacterium]|nr:hypothetical protein [Succinivibrionaceae bacterium]